MKVNKDHYRNLFSIFVALVFMSVSLQLLSQDTLPRPIVEGYGNRNGDYDVISKSPSVVAQMTCSWFAREGNGTYLYSSPEPMVISADWSYEFPEAYQFECAVPPTHPEGEPSIWTPCCSMKWGSTDNNAYNANDPQSCTETGGTNPIGIALGEKIQTEIDLVFSSNSPLHFNRYYNSGASSYQEVASFGVGWSHTYDRRIIAGSINQKSNPSVLYWRRIDGVWIPVGKYNSESQLSIADFDYAYVVRADGKSLYHYYDGTNWQTDYASRSRLSLLPDNSGWVFITENNDAEFYDALGRLVSIENNRGQIQTLYYELGSQDGGDDNLLTLDLIEDQHGNFLRFAYDSNSRIESITTSNGEVYQYNYHSFYRLAQVIYPNSTSRYYGYNNSSEAKLVNITDENGVQYARWEYDNRGRATLSEHGDGSNRYTVAYSMPYSFLSSNNRVGSTTVTNPLGKETTYHFKSWQGIAQLTQVEGHPSTNCAGANKAYTYDANGFMASKTDWQGNVTTYIHNDRGQELSRTEASGTPQARTITTEWHSDFNLPVRIIEPERETVMTYDTNGRLLSRQLQPRSN